MFITFLRSFLINSTFLEHKISLKTSKKKLLQTLVLLSTAEQVPERFAFFVQLLGFHKVSSQIQLRIREHLGDYDYNKKIHHFFYWLKTFF